MEISNPKNYTLITSTEKSFEVFHAAFIRQDLHTVSNHKIVQLSENLNTTIPNLLLFLNVANEHKNNGMSFVIICNGIDIDEISDEINIVPTILEAEDILEMEAIERDLGF
ncbi:MAG: hypothetical protein JKY44_05965 [Flavobacteriaceae bacterium]|nr:hypothetical protein [Flavobacteriaceae bacterium]